MKKSVKNAICLALVLVMVVLFAACSKKEDKGPLFAYTDADGKVVTGYAEDIDTQKDDGEEKDDNGNKNPDKKISITMPLVFLGEEYINDVDSYCEVNGFIKGKINEKDQTVTITMRALTHDLFLVKIGMQVMSNIGGVVDSGDYPYVKELESYSDNFDEIVMLVDGKKYEADQQHSLLPYYLGECGMYYQVFTTENEYECTVKIKDAKSGKIIDEQHYETDNFGKEY